MCPQSLCGFRVRVYVSVLVGLCSFNEVSMRYTSFELCTYAIIRVLSAFLLLWCGKSGRQRHSLSLHTKTEKNEGKWLCFSDCYTPLNMNWSKGKYRLTVGEVHRQHLLSDVGEEGWAKEGTFIRKSTQRSSETSIVIVRFKVILSSI